MKASTEIGVAAMLFVVFAFVAAYLPKIQGKRLVAKLSVCQKNLEQIGIAMKMYHNVHGTFPAVAIYDSDAVPILSWRVLVLPYIGHDALYRGFDLTQAWDSTKNATLLTRMPGTFACPCDPNMNPQMTNVIAVSGDATVFPARRAIGVIDITDRLPYTAMVVEIGNSLIPWTKPEEALFDGSGSELDRLPTPCLRGVRYVLFADGRVRAVLDATKWTVWQGLRTRNGGELIRDSDF
jgi:hypothetical protein